MKIAHLQKPIFTLLFIMLSIIVFGQWQPVNGPSGGYVRSFLYDGSALYAATGGGVLVSDDEGESWSFQNANLSSCDTKSITRLSNYIFVSTDENVFRSNDQGATWQASGTELEGKYVKYITSSNGQLFAATYLRGIYRSADTGNSWVAVNNGFPAKYAYYLDSDGSNIFAGTYQDGMYRSSDQGENWISINNGLTELNIMSILCFADKVFISTLSSGVFVSEDQGASWSAMGTNIPSVKGFTQLDGVLYAASLGQGVYRSIDTGQTWTTFNNNLAESDIWAIGNSNETLFVGVSSGRIYKRNLAEGNWELSSGISFNAGVGSLSGNDFNLLAGTHGCGFFTSDNQGNDWTRASSIWTVETRSIISSGAFVFAGTDMLGVFKSNNYGQTFSMSNTGLNSAWIQAFAICDGQLFAGSGEEGVFVSSDAGTSWSASNQGLTSPNILSLASDGTDVYAGTSDSGIFITSDLGTNWSSISEGINSNKITGIQTLNEVVFVGTNNSGMYKSMDHGSSWISLTNGLSPEAYIRCIYVYDSLILVGTNNGEVFSSSDNGDSWDGVIGGLNGSPVLSLWIQQDQLFAGLSQDGIYKYPLSLITSIKPSMEEEAFAVYPNPTSQVLNFSTLPQAVNALTIYNLQGKIVLRKQLDSNSSHLDVNQIQPGIYILTCQGLDQIYTARFVKN